jgi:hypothetical protein
VRGCFGWAMRYPGVQTCVAWKLGSVWLCGSRAENALGDVV